MNFQKDVIERSREIPVLVDFWAEWCGPCRILTPVLEAVEREQAGRWALVKVNTEEHRELAAQYQIRSIPNVKMFHGGRVVDEFTGALTRPMLERWLDEHLPDLEAGALEALLGQAAGWPDPSIVAPLEAYLLEHPAQVDAQIALAKFLLPGQPVAARALAADIPAGHAHADTATDILALVEVLELEAADTPVGRALSAARAALQQADMEASLQQLIEAVRVDKNFQNSLPRRATVAVFRLLGELHPLTREYRRHFSMALY